MATNWTLPENHGKWVPWERLHTAGLVKWTTTVFHWHRMETSEKGHNRVSHPETFLLALRTGLLLGSLSQPFSGLLFPSQSYAPNFPLLFLFVTFPPMAGAIYCLHKSDDLGSIQVMSQTPHLALILVHFHHLHCLKENAHISLTKQQVHAHYN